MKKIEVVIAGGGNMKRNVFICILCLLGASCTCGQQLRLLTYNVHNCIGLDNVRDYNRIAEIIRSVDADVVALQELDSVTQRNGGVYALEELERLTDMYGFFAAAIPYQGGSYGIGILSKEKPLSCRIIPMSGREEKRVMVIAEFENYVFCATHQSLTPLDQLLSVKEIVKAIEGIHKPIFLAGDMNSAPAEAPQRLLKEYFTILTDTTFYTYPADCPEACLDYIYGYKNNGYRFKLLQTYVLSEPMASDHRPVQTEVVVY